MHHLEHLFLFALTAAARCMPKVPLHQGSPYSNSTISPSSPGPSSTTSTTASVTSSNDAIIASSSPANAPSSPIASTTPRNSSQPLTPDSPAPRPNQNGASGCPSHMKGVVFNANMNPGMFDTIEAADDWITFSPFIPNGPASPKAAAAFIPMIAFEDQVEAGVTMLNSGSPPAWLLTFNEPDFSYTNNEDIKGTPTMTPEVAADKIAPLIAAASGKSTKFVAPGLAFGMSDWLDKFFAACNCKDFFSAYSIHSYHPDSAAVISDMKTFHEKYSDKPIWVTEVAPGNAKPVCSLSQDAVASFMKEVYHFAATSGFVDRVFWNTGNQIGPGDTNVCNSYLTLSTGGAAPLSGPYAEIDCS